MPEASRDSLPASEKRRFVEALAFKSLETVQFIEVLCASPEESQARADLVEHLGGLRVFAEKHGFPHLEAALAAMLDRLEREDFGPAALAGGRVLAWSYESLAAMPCESGTHPVVNDGRHSQEEGPARRGAAEVDLRGRRILVADDEAKVRWSYVGILREAGARVLEAGDGVQALALARAQEPDVILADIVMPRLDGLALCAAVRREPALDGIPVVLLSWHDDFLHRMQELRSEAQGYLRKEVPPHEILGCVSRVLGPLRRVEKLLASDREVSGELENLGVSVLFRAIRRLRPNASVALQDPWSLFSVILHDGSIVAVQRTAIDGAVTHDDAALLALVGMSSGRFAVAGLDERGDGQERESLEPAFTRATRRLGIILNAMAAHPDCQLKFDDLVLGTYFRHSPVRVQALIARLHGGEPPQALWESGAASRALVDALLDTLARQGAIRELVLDAQEPAGDGEAEPIEHEIEREARSASDATERENHRGRSALAMHGEPANRAPEWTDSIWRRRVGPRGNAHEMVSGFGMQARTRARLIGIAFTVVLGATAAFLLWAGLRQPQVSREDTARTGSSEVAAARPEPGGTRGGASSAARSASEASRVTEHPDFSAFSGTLRPGVDPSLPVAEGQGVLELSGPSELSIDVDGVGRGPLPLTLVLEEGIHRVRYRGASRTTSRFYLVESGATRIVHAVTQAGGLVDPL